MEDRIQYLHEQRPFTICKIKLTKNPKTYLCLANNESCYTVYTNEGKGFVMTADNNSTSKRIQVDIIYEPIGLPETLFDCTYPPIYEEFKQKAIEYLYKKDKKLNPQASEILSKLKDAACKLTEVPLPNDEREQQEIIKGLVQNKYSKVDILNRLLNLKVEEPEIVFINSKSFKRENLIIAQIKYVRGSSCQICGTSILTKEGTPFIEAAHIKPKHLKGAETLNNIILLCPNHHKEFDLGERKVLTQTDTSIEFMLNGKTYTVHFIPDLNE